MDSPLYTNDIDEVIENDRAHVWHHLTQHKPFETVDPRIIVEGKGLRVWDARGKELIDGLSGGVLDRECRLRPNAYRGRDQGPAR